MTTALTKVERLPPHSPEAEAGVLGCILLEPETSMAVCVVAFKAGAEVFFDLRNRLLYAVLVEMVDQGFTVDIITLGERLKVRGLLEQVGGLSQLVLLPDGVPSAANIGYYVEIVLEKYKCRRLLTACVTIEEKMYKVGEMGELLGMAEETIIDVTRGQEVVKEVQGPGLVAFAKERMEHYKQNKGQMLGLSFGFDYLDKMTCGMVGGQLIVFAARPGMGKTSLGMNFVEHTAINDKLPVGVFSLEMTAQELGCRLLFQRARCDYQRFRTGFFEAFDRPKLEAAMKEIEQAPIYVDDTSGLTIVQLRSKARRLVRMYGIKWLLVDYLQLMRPGQRFQNREQEVAEISGGLKSLAKDLNIPVVVLAQFNRDIEKEPGRKPRLSDLRESGSIEQDADLVGMIYPPKLKDEEKCAMSDANPDWAKHYHRANILIAKQRNGPTGDFETLYWKACMRFEAYKRPAKKLELISNYKDD